jgi:hypothetical protein
VTREESLLTVAAIVNGWPATAHEWSDEQMESYASAIQDMDYEITAKSIRLAVRQLKFRPAISELREFAEGQRRGMMPSPSDSTPRSRPPAWIFRWACARFLYARFNREQDMRRFAEQGEWVDPVTEVMPSTEWEREADQITESQVWAAVQAAPIAATANVGPGDLIQLLKATETA